MIKLVVFDLDGVLVDAREIHYEALNAALADIDQKYVIGRQEHLSIYDGLSTTKKLKMLTKNKGLPEEFHNAVWNLKQQKTVEIINNFNVDDRICSILRKLKHDGYYCLCNKFYTKTAKLQLIRKGFFEHIDFLYSNQDVIKPKPSAEIYLRCMLRANVDPNETIIIEDSHHGRRAAINSGGHLCAVKNSSDVTYEKIKNMIDEINNKENIKPKWQGGKMNVLIPMAGAGSRFAKSRVYFSKTFNRSSWKTNDPIGCGKSKH
jgi:HAD superfamily hydrolase (TIGR01509 family)